MPNIIMILILSFVLNAFSFTFAKDFSAFVSEGVLYATVLTDQCNLHAAGLEIDPDCNKNRQTKNLAFNCQAELLIYQTLHQCEETRLQPQTFALRLDETKIAPEARTLILSYEGEEERVEIPMEKDH